MVTVTQNIPSGLTLAQANSALFQTNFIQVRITATVAVRVNDTLSLFLHFATDDCLSFLPFFLPYHIPLFTSFSLHFLYHQATATSAGVPPSAVTIRGITTGRRLLTGQTVMYDINTAALLPTTAPAPSPISSSNALGGYSLPSCFAGSELVTLENGATKAMADVQVGDRILTINAKGEQVFSAIAYLPHGKNEAASTFVTVATASGRDVKMTANHILPAGACAAQTLPMVSADQVVVGDCVETVSGREQVVSVGKIEGKGIYTIIAMEELIVVNGIVATPYGGVNPTLANIYYNLHRLMYAYAPSVMSKNWVQSATEMLWGDLSTLNA